MDSCLVFVLWWIDVSAKDYANLWRTSVDRQLASSCHLPRGWSLNDSSTVRQLIYREFIKIMYKNFTCTKFYREGEAPSPRTTPLNRTMLLKYEQMAAVYIFPLLRQSNTCIFDHILNISCPSTVDAQIQRSLSWVSFFLESVFFRQWYYWCYTSPLVQVVHWKAINQKIQL